MTARRQTQRKNNFPRAIRKIRRGWWIKMPCHCEDPAFAGDDLSSVALAKEEAINPISDGSPRPADAGLAMTDEFEHHPGSLSDFR